MTDHWDCPICTEGYPADHPDAQCGAQRWERITVAIEAARKLSGLSEQFEGVSDLRAALTHLDGKAPK